MTLNQHLADCLSPESKAAAKEIAARDIQWLFLPCHGYSEYILGQTLQPKENKKWKDFEWSGSSNNSWLEVRSW